MASLVSHTKLAVNMRTNCHICSKTFRHLFVFDCTCTEYHSLELPFKNNNLSKFQMDRRRLLNNQLKKWDTIAIQWRVVSSFVTVHTFCTSRVSNGRQALLIHAIYSQLFSLCRLPGRAEHCSLTVLLTRRRRFKLKHTNKVNLQNAPAIR